jgi:hypothetical protein
MSRVAPHRLPLGLVSALLVVLGAPAAAGADVGATIIERCTHGQSLSGFSQQAYRQALQELPSEVEEYSDCANLIRNAQLATAGGGGGGAAGGVGGPAGSTPTPIPLTPAERSALARAAKTRPPALLVGGHVVRPGVVNAGVASAVSSLPTPLLTILAFGLACVLVFAGGALRNRVRDHRRS